MNETHQLQFPFTKSGYTLVEGLISMLLISIIGLAASRFAGTYFKTAYDRDRQMASYLQNLSVIERLKAEVKTLPQLYAFSLENPIKIIAVGQGEVTLDETADGVKVNAVSSESFTFSDKLQSGSSRLLRIEVGGDLPNSKLVAVLRLEDDDGG